MGAVHDLSNRGNLPAVRGVGALTRTEGDVMRGIRIARGTIVAGLSTLLIFGPAVSALACGGLVAPNGTITLLKTTTLAAYHQGVEHYVTSFEFAGKDAGEVGSIIPLPGVPTKVIKAGGWTLQRLVQEVTPQPASDVLALSAESGGSRAQVLLETQIDALDITVLKGGAVAVGTWASDHGFFLPPDAPEVLDFYAQRSPIFMAARFNLDRARDQGVQTGEGTPIQVVIPTPNPWVPLRILGLGRQNAEIVQADVFLLTDMAPATLPQAIEPNGDQDQRGLIQEVSRPASPALLQDLRSDKRMGWIPERDMWLTYIRINEEASKLTHDLAIDASGFAQPDPVAAGLARPLVSLPQDPEPGTATIAALAVAGLAAVVAGAFWLGRSGARRRTGGHAA
jgi:hypothetical protein